MKRSQRLPVTILETTFKIKALIRGIDSRILLNLSFTTITLFTMIEQEQSSAIVAPVRNEICVPDALLHIGEFLPGFAPITLLHQIHRI